MIVFLDFHFCRFDSALFPPWIVISTAFQCNFHCIIIFSRLVLLNYIREVFILRSNGYSLRGHLRIVIPRLTSSYMQHSFTYQASKQWNNLPDKIRMSESLSTFRKNLQNIQLSSFYDCNCMFCK